MIVFTAVDDTNGMLFNKRRQSQDSVLREHMLTLCGENPLFVTPYTAKQFSAEQQARLRIEENPLEAAAKGDFCFIETLPLMPYAEKIEKVCLYKWNRRYPADFFFDLPLSAPAWKLEETEEFAGTSHDTITKEVFIHETSEA